MNTTRAFAESLDTEDPLAPLRDEFVIDEDIVYVDGNSLGRLPKRTTSRLAEVIEHEWGRLLVSGWDEWMLLASRIGNLIGEGLLGAAEVILSDSTSVNIYKLASAALDARPDRNVIVTEARNFPTDLYILQGLAEQRGLELRLVDTALDMRVTPENLAPLLDDRVALVSLSHVSYLTSGLADMHAITALIHSHGALSLWDLCHSAGSIPVDLQSCNADLAVGCTYKYLNAGPGAPAFLYVRSDLQETLRQPIWGWFGQRDQFDMGPHYDPEPGISKFLVGTPPVISLAAVQTGAEVLIEAGIDRLKTKSDALTSYAIELFDEWLAPHGASLGTPRDAAHRGSHLAIRHPDAFEICREMIAGKVIPDFRQPDVVRIATPPVYTRFVDVWIALDTLRAVLEKRRP